MRSEAIDILKLYAEGDTKKWNAYLRASFLKEDVSGLSDTLRRLQMGMDNLVQQKLNTDKVSVLFLRLQRSIENTIRDIHRKQNPNPLYGAKDKSQHGQHLKEKRKKQEELETYLRKARF